jgi:tRNA(Ile)-lysidine synthase TilS/MesJ
MGCSKCGRPGVIFQEYSGLHLCRQHFAEDLLHKAKKTVRENHWLVPGERYAVALSGGPASCALLNFMHALVGGRKDISLIAVTIKSNDPDAMENARAITDTSGIPWYVIEEENAIKKNTQQSGPCSTNRSPFTAHTLTEASLALMAEQQEVDALVLGYTLEDHAEWVLWNVISGAGLPKTGDVTGGRKRVRIVRPFMHVPAEEIDLYTRLFLEDYYKKRDRESGKHMVDPVNTILARFYKRHPGVPYALVNIGEQVKKFRDQVT